MDPNKNNTFDMDIRSPLRELNLQNNTNPEQNNSSNKSVNLLDVTTTNLDNSILMPATDPENLNTLDVTSTNQENQRPRFSILGTFDPIYQKKESADNGKSDSADAVLQSLIDETLIKQPVSEVIGEPLKRNNEYLNLATGFVDECVKKVVDGAGIYLAAPENEFNNSSGSSVSDVSEQNNTVILSKTFTENKDNLDKSASDSVLSVNEETPKKFVPHIKLSEATDVSDLSDSFLDKFTRATVISTPTSKNTTRTSQNVLDNTFAKEDPVEVVDQKVKLTEELDTQDTDSIELENPISQSEDFDTDSLNEEIESAQNEILHELSVESNKIVCELNKTQEIFNEAVAPETIQEDIVTGTDLTKNKSFEIIEKEKLPPVQLEQKEQIIQEINVTYSEPISPNKLERQEEVLIEKDKPQVENFEEKKLVSPQKISIEIAEPQSPKPANLEQTVETVKSVVLEEKELIPQESNTKNSEPISPNKVEHHVEVLTESVDKNTPVKWIDQNISFEISSTPTTKPAHEFDSAFNKNISFVIDSSPIAKVKSESQKLSEIVKEQDIGGEVVDPVNKNISFVIDSSPIEKVKAESPQKLCEVSSAFSPVKSTPELDPIVNKNLSFTIESSPTAKSKPETPQKVCEIIQGQVIEGEAADSVNNNLSFVIDPSPIVQEKPESPKKLCEVSSVFPPAKFTSVVDPVINKNLSFTIESSPIVKAKPESPQKLSEIIQGENIEGEVVDSINKNLSFVIDSSSIVKAKPESPQKLCEVSSVFSPAKFTQEVDFIETKPVNKNLSFVIDSSSVVKTKPESIQKLLNISSGISSSPATKSTPEVEPLETDIAKKNISFVIESPIAKVQPKSPEKFAEGIKSEDIGSDEIIVKTPQTVEIETKPIEEILTTPIVELVNSESSEIKDKHMSEAKPIENSEVSESAVTNSAPLNEMGEVINQNDCFQKQSDITNGAVDNKESLDPKNEMYNEMVERLSLLESECEKYKVQVADLKREIKTCRQKSVSLESEVADLKRKENELNILLDEYKNKKPESTDSDGKDEELKLLRASEEALKKEVVELKVLVKQHENKLKELQQKEVKLADDLSSKTQSELQISRVMEEYEKSISSLVAENEKMKKERDTAQMHLSNIELAFSDVHQKYERCKRVVQGYKDNEESYRQDIAMNRETIATQEQKYATLKAHAMAQLEKSNQELLGIKKQYETEIARLTAQLKRYEIKNDSLMESLQQKTKECEQLSAVCDEFIGNV